MAITPLPPPPNRSAPSTFSTLADAFLGALPRFVTEANAQAAALELNDTTDASASSATIGTGAKTFVVTAGKSFQPGMFLMIADEAAPSTNWMHGQVTSYSGTTLVMNITAIGGSGTKTAWIITFSAPTGLPTATAESDFILSGPSPFSWVKKTLAQVKTILGLGAAAYGGYATAAEITAGLESAKAIAPDQLALSKYNLRVLMTGQVTITNANTGQPHWLMTTALTANVSLPYSLPNANYTVLVEVEDADFKERVGEIKISSKAINGFTITVTGNTNNIDLRWTVVDPNYWTR